MGRSASAVGRQNRVKGKVWERALVNLLRPIFGDTVKRGLAQARFGAAEEADVKGVPRLWIEAKCGKKVNPRAALAQAIEAEAASRVGAVIAGGQLVPPDRRWPVAMCKDDQKLPGQGANTFVVMQLDDFVALLGEWWRATRSAPCSSPPVPPPAA